MTSIEKLADAIKHQTPANQLRFAADALETAKRHDRNGDHSRAVTALRIAQNIIRGIDIELSAVLQMDNIRRASEPAPETMRSGEREAMERR
jgi:hypothetical protein